VGFIRPSAFGALLIAGAIWVIVSGPAWVGTLMSVRGMLRLAVVGWIVWRLGRDYVRLWQALRQLAKAG
jgi:hypothetical protein